MSARLLRIIPAAALALLILTSQLAAQPNDLGHQITGLSGDRPVVVDYPTSPGTTETVEFQKRRSVVDAGTRGVIGTLHGDSEVIVPKVAFYTGRGTRTGAHVWLAVFPDRGAAMGFSQIEGGGTYTLVIEPETKSGEFHTTLSSTRGMRPSASDRPLCGVKDDEHPSLLDPLPDPLTPELLAEKPLLMTDIAVETDTSFFMATGGTLVKAQEYAIALYSAVSALYEDNTHIVFRISWLRTWTDLYPDSYAAAGDPFVLRDSVAAHYDSAYAGVPRDILQVLTSISYGGGGYGYLDAICGKAGNKSFSAVSVQGSNTLPAPGFAYDVYITAHELGHNFNAQHSHNCIWGAPLDTCEVQEGIDGGCLTQGTEPRVNPGSIMSYCGGRNYSAGLGYTVEMTFLPIVSAVIRQTAEKAECLQELKAPVQVEPVDKVLEISPEVTFRWNTDSAFAGYALTVSTDTNFTGDVLRVVDTGGMIQQTLLPQTIYYWYVQGVTRFGSVVTSPVWSFSTTTAPSGVEGELGRNAVRAILSRDHSRLTIEVPGVEIRGSVAVNDVAGRTIVCREMERGVGRIVLDVSHLSAGRYFTVLGRSVLPFVVP